MEWIIFILAAIAYFMIGGFISGLIDLDMELGIVICSMDDMDFDRVRRRCGLWTSRSIRTQKGRN